MALEAYQLSTGLSRLLPDPQQSVSSLCQSASVLLDLGAPDLALVIKMCDKSSIIDGFVPVMQFIIPDTWFFH